MLDRYPKATWLGNGQSGGTYTSGPFKVVLHTTETRTVPGYQSGAVAPHLTFAPASRQWYQHTELTTAARALRNEAGGAQTNRDSALQVEIVCYSAKATAEQVGGLWVGNLTKEALDDVRALIEWTGVPLEWPGHQALSYAEANKVGFRLTQAEWDKYAGVVGHQHVPENDHWDPGALDWAYLMRDLDLEGDDMAVSDWAKNAWDWATGLGIFTKDSNPQDPITVEQFGVFLSRYNNQVKKLVAGVAAGGVTAGAVIAEIINRLS